MVLSHKHFIKYITYALDRCVFRKIIKRQHGALKQRDTERVKHKHNLHITSICRPLAEPGFELTHRSYIRCTYCQWQAWIWGVSGFPGS